MDMPPDFPPRKIRVAKADIADRWHALQQAAALVASLAAEAPAEDGEAAAHFPDAVERAGGWRRALAEQGTEDLTIVLRTGIAALLAAHSRNLATEASARALWEEFAVARSALLALCPPEHGRQRTL